MVIFTPDQLALLQASLSPPMPALTPSPQMTSSSSVAAAAAAAPSAAAASGPQGSPARTAVPLAAVGAGYGAVALGVALAALVSPAQVRQASLLSSPVLALALGLHVLAVPAAPLAQALGLLCALTHPLACHMPHPWGLWGSALCLSLFLSAAPPQGRLRCTALSGAIGVLLAGGLLGAGGPPRAAWGIVLVSLSLQAAASLARLSRCTLRCLVLD